MPTDFEKRHENEPPLPCVGCGFDLRATYEDKCPECGTPVQISLRKDAIMHADFHYRVAIRKACHAVCICLLAVLPLAIILGLIHDKLQEKDIIPLDAANPTIQLTMLFVGVMLLRAQWYATATEPNRTRPRPAEPWRKIAWITLPTTIAGRVADVLLLVIVLIPAESLAALPEPWVSRLALLVPIWGLLALFQGLSLIAVIQVLTDVSFRFKGPDPTPTARLIQWLSLAGLPTMMVCVTLLVTRHQIGLPGLAYGAIVGFIGVLCLAMLCLAWVFGWMCAQISSHIDTTLPDR